MYTRIQDQALRRRGPSRAKRGTAFGWCIAGIWILPGEVFPHIPDTTRIPTKSHQNAPMSLTGATSRPGRQRYRAPGGQRRTPQHHPDTASRRLIGRRRDARFGVMASRNTCFKAINADSPRLKPGAIIGPCTFCNRKSQIRPKTKNAFIGLKAPKSNWTQMWLV